MRFKHYSLRTERTYREWVKPFILFHGKRHPREMGAVEVGGFLSDVVRAGEQGQNLVETRAREAIVPLEQHRRNRRPPLLDPAGQGGYGFGQESRIGLQLPGHEPIQRQAPPVNPFM